MIPAAKMTSLADTYLVSVPAESPAAILPRIHSDCSQTSGCASSEINVGIASACRSRKCCDDADSCVGKDAVVGGGKKGDAVFVVV